MSLMKGLGTGEPSVMSLATGVYSEQDSNTCLDHWLGIQIPHHARRACHVCQANPSKFGRGGGSLE